MGMISEMRANMAKPAWPVLVALSLSIPIVPLTAEAGKHGGGSGGGGDDGGGGRLGQVSSGLGRATGGSASPGPVSSPSSDTVRDHRYRDRYERDHYYGEPVVVVGAGADTEAGPPEPPGPPRRVFVDFYAGVQKVYESDGSLSAELAFNEGRFRLGGSITRYFESQEGQDALTFTLGSLYLGFRIDDGGPTRAYLEAGAVGARTRNDPAMDSSVAGLLGGVRVEHTLVPRRVTLLGDAQAMAFEDNVRAGAVRVGLRLGNLQATFRYVDFNVGPALLGPEIGLAY
jgi:hypothetical protein